MQEQQKFKDHRAHNFSAVIMGSGTLPIQCSEMLLTEGHEIVAIVTTDAEVTKWASAKGLDCIAPDRDLAEAIGRTFDYLFSINNEFILSEDTLRLPLKFAINYHDSLLPKYAGTHATSWALMNGERTHGITWHVAGTRVDAGDILLQREIEIATDETALSLNLKCFESAILGFKDLIAQLGNENITHCVQDLDERSFFARFERPRNAGIVSWYRSADEIVRQVRALEFGNYPNPLGKAKVMIGDDYVVIQDAELVDGPTSELPGTIALLDDKGLGIVAKDNVVLIKRLSTNTGENLGVSDLAIRHDLKVGDRFVDIASPEMERRSDAVEALVKATSRNEAYWVEKLSRTTPIALPYVRNTDSALGLGIQKLSVPMPDALTLTGTEFRNSVFAAFCVLVSRLSGFNKFTVGYSSLMLDNGVRDLAGMFATTVPFDVEIDEMGTFKILLDAIAEEVNKTNDKQTFLVDAILRYPELETLRNTNLHDLFPLTFAEAVDAENYSPKPASDLVLVCGDRDARLIFDASRFDKEKIANLAECLSTLLANLVADRNQETGDAEYLPLEERNRLIRDGRGPISSYPRESCIHRLFELKAEEYAEHTAVIFNGETFRYREIDQRANRFANHLLKRGVRLGEFVGIAAERSIEAVVAILGILKAGGTYVPISPACPTERLKHIVDDTSMRVLLSQSAIASRFEEHVQDVVCLDVDVDADSSSPVLELSSDSAAYAIYTSGTTGQPKGVLVSHRALVNHATAISRHYELDEADRVLQFSSLSFDVAAEEIFPTILSGAAIVIVPESDLSSMNRFREFVCSNSVSIINLPTSYWRQWTAALVTAKKSFPDSVRLLIAGSERVLPEDYNSWRELAPTKVRWLNAYGLTETTITSLVYEPSDRDQELATVPIGKPIDNVSVFVLDSSMRPVPKGVQGQLYVGGDCVALGYLKMPDVTAERFVQNPFGSQGNDLIYETGDIVRMLDDGNLEYVGRNDDQVKLRGFRIELGEIETVLSSHPKLSEGAVIAVTNPHSGETELAAYLVPKNDSAAQRASSNIRANSHVSISALQTFLGEHLPSYMVPSTFTELERLPLTANGKVDRRALPLPVYELAEARNGHKTSRTGTEAKLTEIWTELLGYEQIGVNENFFDLGGHSLLAIRMFTKIEASFRKSIPLATLFEAGTIENLASILDQDDWQEPESALVPIQPLGDRPPFFCVHAKGGNVLFYRDLAKHLGNDQPFYGIQARRIGGRQVGHATVEEMAETYIREMKGLQPEGPYYIGGASFGGLAAFEIAQQLRRNGDEVALLALLDTGSPDYPRPLPNTSRIRSRINSLVNRTRLHRDSLVGLSNRGRLSYIVEKIGKLKLKYRRKVVNSYKLAAREFYLRKNGEGSIPAKYIQVEDQIAKAGEKYQPKAYAGKVTLFRASNQPVGFQEDPTLGWGPFVSGELEINDVPGHHGSIVNEPYVGVLAAKLRASIERAMPVIDEKPRENTGTPTISRGFAASANNGIRKLLGLLFVFNLQLDSLCAESLALLAGLGLLIR